MMRCDENGVPCVVQSMTLFYGINENSIGFELYDGSRDFIGSPNKNIDLTIEQWADAENEITRQFFADKTAEKFERLTTTSEGE